MEQAPYLRDIALKLRHERLDIQIGGQCNPVPCPTKQTGSIKRSSNAPQTLCRYRIGNSSTTNDRLARTRRSRCYDCDGCITPGWRRPATSRRAQGIVAAVGKQTQCGRIVGGLCLVATAPMWHTRLRPRHAGTEHDEAGVHPTLATGGQGHDDHNHAGTHRRIGGRMRQVALATIEEVGMFKQS